jgi:type I restriction enzyme S subunit
MGKWERRKLTELAEYLNGYAFAPDDWGAEGLPIIRIEQLKNPNAPADFYAGKLPEKNIIEDGDLIFSWSASLFLRIWKNGRAALNQHLFKVVEKPGVNREFLKSFIEFYLPELTKASHGSTMQHITRKELEKFSAQFPIDETEQEKIADVIAALDRAIEQTEALIAKQQRIKTGLMQDLLTKGIDEHGNIRSEATHAFKDSSLGRIPVEWRVVKTGEVCESLVPGRDKPELDGGGIPWITIPDIQEESYISGSKFQLSLSPQTIRAANARLMPKDTVLMSCVGEFGIAAIATTELVANQQLHGFVCGHVIVPEWLMFQIRSSGRRIDLMATQTTIKYLNKAGCESILIVLPDEQEQRRLVGLILKATESSSVYKTQLNKYLKLKAGLMHELLTGKRRVTDLLEPKTE